MGKSEIPKNKMTITTQDIIENRWDFDENKEITCVEFTGLTDRIHYRAFCKCVNLAKVVLPFTLRVIEWSAFEGCKKLLSIQFPIGLEEIEENAFRACDKLQSVAIPVTVKSIGKTAFRTCKSLNKVSISKAVKKIGKDAFAGCPNLVIYTEKGSAAEKYAAGAGIPVNILPSEELQAAIKEECMPERDVLAGKLEMIKYTNTAVIAERNGKRVLIVNRIKYPLHAAAGSEDEKREKKVLGASFGFAVPEYSAYDPSNSMSKEEDYEFYSRMDVIENVLSLKKEGVEFLEAFIKFGYNAKKEIQSYCTDSVKDAFSSFDKLCELLKNEKALQSVVEFVPCKKDGSLVSKSLTSIASLPLFIHNVDSYEKQERLNRGPQFICRMSDVSYDLVAKNVSENVIEIYVDKVDLYQGIDEDRFNTPTQIADQEIAETILRVLD